MQFLFVAATLGVTTLLAAQEAYVPLSEEPLHVPVLSNDAVRAVNVTLPPGESTLFHEHSADVVTVTLEGADLINQNWQEQPTSVQRSTGRVAYAAYGDSSHVHRVSNAGQSTFRIIAVELFSPRPTGLEAHAHRTGLNEIALENARVRIWRLALEPGQTNTLAPLQLPTLRITATGGRIVATTDTDPPIDKRTESGELVWLPAGTAITVRNAGDSLVVLYDVEIK
jgi:quercetin dioxygenase-like cupin family protein